MLQLIIILQLPSEASSKPAKAPVRRGMGNCDALWLLLQVYPRYLQRWNQNLPRAIRAISCFSPPDYSASLKLWEVMSLKNLEFWSVCILMDKLLVRGLYKRNGFFRKWKTVQTEYQKLNANNQLIKKAFFKLIFLISIRASLSQTCDPATQRHRDLDGCQELDMILSASSQDVANP